MADSQPHAGPSPEPITQSFVRYLKAATAEDREAIVRSHPSLFCEPVVVALDDARQQLRATMREVAEACRMINAVSGGLEFTGASVELQPGETQALMDEDAVLQNFAQHLASLLAEREKQGRRLQVPQTAAPDAAAPGLLTSAEVGASAQREQWFAQPALVLAVLSYLPAETVFMAAENVCRSWQTWLYQPEVSRFFWIGAVQREFPQQLQVLLQTEGEDLFESDWRSIAMLCVAEAEEEEGEGEGEGSDDAAGTSAA